MKRIEEISSVVNDPKLGQAHQRLESIVSLDPEESDPETVKAADGKIQEVRGVIDQVRKEHLKEIRQIDLDGVVAFFNEHIRSHARPSEATAFDKLVKTAQRSIDRKDKDFEYHLDELKGKNFDILWRQDWFVVDRFKWMVNSPHLFADKCRFGELVEMGMQLMRSDDIEKLRDVVAQLWKIQISSGAESEIFAVANIIWG